MHRLDLLTLHAEAFGEKVAVIDDRPDGTLTRWSYAELEANANRLGRVLLDAGVEPTDKVLWCGQNSPWVVAMVHAARKIGAVAVPLNYRLTEEEAAYVADNCDAVVAFVDAEFAPLLAAIRSEAAEAPVTCSSTTGACGWSARRAAAARGGRWQRARHRRRPGAAGTMIYTSAPPASQRARCAWGRAIRRPRDGTSRSTR